ncbi:MAG: carboxymuconolactone decarboxylase family protein [Thermoplasmata archaeon]|nr:MAG: carboxymuconolactone decarboxylase family protein [Thermoplasmata archaeon]
MNRREFNAYRVRMNKRILEEGSLCTRRFFSLDESVYREGKLPAKTKEMLGLVTSTVLRCNECILYHIQQCMELGCTAEEMYEALDVALVVGGSITIPHVRYAYEMIDEIRNEGTASGK